jgi:YfiH family protein
MDLSDLFRSDKIHAAFSLKTFTHNGNARKLLSSLINLDPNKIVSPQQVHSSEVKVVDVPGKIPFTDAIISTSKSVVLSIQVADCIPLYLADPDNNVIGIVHAGWRGIEKGIVANSISKMITLGADNNRIIAYIGPSIQKCCFEIGPEVAKKFPINFQINSSYDRSFLDLQKLTKNILINNSISYNNIISSNECTKCNSDKYFSYRNTGLKSGRMIGIIGLT